MIFNIQHTANWEYIHARKQRLIHKNNQNENKKRVPHTYQVNDKVIMRKGTKTSDVLNPTRRSQTPFMGESAICDFLRREDELMTELLNQKRSTSY